MISQLNRLNGFFQAAIMVVCISQWIYYQPALAAAIITAQTSVDSEASLCPSPALSRLQSHQVMAGETLESIAATYDLLPITLIGMNPTVQGQPITAGMTLLIPPFNGIEVAVAQGLTWQDLAVTYQLRADILFEVNGCPAVMPARIFVPGVNWFADTETAAASNNQAADNDPLTGYPLSEAGTIVANFGWRSHPDQDDLVFSSGITLETSNGATVQSVGDGIVAYVGQEETLGNLVVINHADGLQTRYAQIINPQVSSGDRVRSGQTLATAAPRSEAVAVLHFEVRTNSALGWVARDPGDYIPTLAVR